MPRHNDFEVWVESEGTGLKECGIETNGNIKSCLIPSETGKTFCVKWQNLQYYALNHYKLDFKADGTVVNNVIITPASNSYTMQGIVVDKETLKPLVFSEVDLSEYASESVHKDELETISVTIHTVKVIREEDYDWDRYRAPNLNAIPWYEKHAKACSHRVATGEEIRFPTTWQQVITEPYNDEPVAVFRFRYRPESYLRAQGLLAQVGPAIAVGPDSAVVSRKRIRNTVGSERTSQDLSKLKDLQKQLSENQRKMDKLLKKDNSNNSKHLLKSMRRLQGQRRELEQQQSELLKQTKESGSRSRKKLKREPGLTTRASQGKNTAIIDLCSG